MNIRSQGKAKTLFIYPGSDNPYISVKGLKSEVQQACAPPADAKPYFHRKSRKSLAT